MGACKVYMSTFEIYSMKQVFTRRMHPCKRMCREKISAQRRYERSGVFSWLEKRDIGCRTEIRCMLLDAKRTRTHNCLRSSTSSSFYGPRPFTPSAQSSLDHVPAFTCHRVRVIEQSSPAPSHPLLPSVLGLQPQITATANYYSGDPPHSYSQTPYPTRRLPRTSSSPPRVPCFV